MSEMDNVFRELAKRYTKAYGESLWAENQELRGQNVNLPQADRTVKRLLWKSRRRLIYAVGGLTAACLIFAIMLPAKNGLFSDVNTKVVTSDDQDKAGQPDLSSQSTGEIIPLAFVLPDNLTVRETMVDQGQSVYLLTDQMQDDVVLTVERQAAGTETEETSEMIRMELNGHPVYLREDAAYQQLLCYKGDLIYRMTCRYDINTILPIAEKIFSNEL